MDGYLTVIPVCSYGVVSTFPSESSVEPEYHEVIIPPKLSSNHFPILTIRYLHRLQYL